jgi:hypothetical protein
MTTMPSVYPRIRGYTGGMPEITIFPHGDRWAVAERGAESPSKEFPSREAAEMAARQMAAGGSVEVLDEDPMGLERVVPDDAGRDERAGTEPPQASDVPESARSTQPGL